MILQGKEEIVAEAKRIIDARLGEESSRYSFIPALDDRAALALWQRIVAAHCGSALWQRSAVSSRCA
jgi:hypothetical protein